MRHKPYDLTRHDGLTVNWRTKAMLMTVEERLGYRLNLTQGSYNDDVEDSAGTHDGGGAVDLVTEEPEKVVRVMANTGFAAFHREHGWDGDDGIEHIHALAIGDRDLSPLAALQVQGYLAHPPRDGLGPWPFGLDDGYRPKPPQVFDYARWQHQRRLKARIAALLHKRERVNRDLEQARRRLRESRH